MEEVVRRDGDVSLWLGWFVVEHGQSGVGSATMLNSERSEGCSKMGLFRSRWVVKSSVHAWSLVIVVVSVMIAAIVVVVVLLPLASFVLGALSQSGCADAQLFKGHLSWP